MLLQGVEYIYPILFPFQKLVYDIATPVIKSDFLNTYELKGGFRTIVSFLVVPCNSLIQPNLAYKIR